MLFVAAAAFGLAACNDTDAQYTIPEVDAPVLVKTTPETGASKVRRGDITVTVEFDKKVFFATKNMAQIQVTGATLVSADVIGSSETFTMVVNCPERETPVSITIPEGLITNGQGKAAPAVSLSFTTVALDKTPVIATGKAARLHSFLLDNFETKALSAIMADVAWNSDEAEKVYQWTGKYPAINGFDYIHMPASEAGANWIDYMDITPVQSWANAGGIVAAGWHWLVPKKLKDVEMPGDWSGFLQLTNDKAKDVLNTAVVGDRIVVAIKDVAEGAQGSIKNSSWTGFVDESGTSWEYFDISGDSYEMILDATTLADMQANGFILSGHDYTVTGVYLVPAGKELADGTRLDDPFSALDPNEDYTYVPDDTDFDAANALTAGTWENEVWKRDMASIVKYLTLLKEAGIPVLWRPFHEAAGQWFWWGKDAATFKALWVEMFTEFRNAGLDNLLWVWTSEVTDTDWYPGDEYVDIVGCDLYSKQTADCVSAYASLSAEYGNKIITLSECGSVDNMSEQWAAGAKWSWFMPWYEGETEDEEGNKTPVVHADRAWWQDAFECSFVLDREAVKTALQ